MSAIKTYREKHSLTQRELADKLGVSQNFISKAELGERFFSPKKATEIEKKTKGAIKRVQLRPDIFGSAP